MDIKDGLKKLYAYLMHYKYVALVLLIGIGLMLIGPVTKSSHERSQSENVQAAECENHAQQIEQILTQIRGAGKVKVLLTVAEGEKTLYQTDQNTSGQSVRIETVIVSDPQRNEQGLIQQVISPCFRGAVVVCQGADDPNVKLSIMEAVKNATGLGYDRICVLKMK